MAQQPPAVLHEGKFLRLVRRGEWEFVQRTNASAVVGVVAVTEDRELLLVEQYRPPLGAAVVELPAGLVGDEQAHAGEDLTAAAKRELLEETGYTATDCQILAAGPSSAGLSNEVITFVRATGLRRTGPAAGDGTERITLHAVPLDQVRNWLASRAAAGQLIDFKVYAGLYFTG